MTGIIPSGPLPETTVQNGSLVPPYKNRRLLDLDNEQWKQIPRMEGNYHYFNLLNRVMWSKMVGDFVKKIYYR